MNKNEFDRLKKGEKLLRQIQGADQQIASLKKVKFISLTTSKTVRISDERHWVDDKETEKVVDYNIAINPDDTKPHPFALPAKEFIATLITGIEQKRDLLQKEFDEL